MVKTKIKGVKKKVNLLHLSLSLGDRIYETETETIPEALEIIYKDSFGKVKTWGVFNLQSGGKSASIRMRPLPIKRLFNGKFAKDLFQKRMEMMLK